VPPEAVTVGATAVATCTDDDPLCDLDRTPGRCTFAVAVCANMPDPLLRACRTDERIESLAIVSPRRDAPPGSIERQNADALVHALPTFPFEGEGTCGVAVPFIVPRLRPDRPGVADIRLRARSATRRDIDHVRFRCVPP